MAKQKRHAAVRGVVQSRRGGSQEQFRGLLETRAFDLTHATLYGDNREL